MLEHLCGGLATCSGETVVAHWAEVLDAEASIPGSSGVVLESSVTALETEGPSLALASATGPSMVV
jgi:hypothetical protein